LVQQLDQSGRLKPGEMDPLSARLSALMLEASKAGTPPDRARQAFLEAYKVGQEVAKSMKPPAPRPDPTAAKDPPKADPEWGPKLDALMKKYQDLVGRLAGTSAGPLMLTPGPVADPDKAVAGLPEADRGRAKRLLALRGQFLLAV